MALTHSPIYPLDRANVVMQSNEVRDPRLLFAVAQSIWVPQDLVRRGG